MTNEHVLLAQWINGKNEEAFHGIVRRYSGLVYATSLRVLRNDADAQEAALDAFLALSQLRRVPDSPLGAWLHRTAVHRAIDRHRKTQTRQRHESALVREAPSETSAVGWDDISGMVDEAVAALPEELRQAVVGHFFEGRTHAELADAAGLSRPAITKRVHHGVEEVRSALIRKGVTVGSVAALTLLLEEHAVAAPAVPAVLAASLGKIAVSGFTAAGAAAGASMGLAAKSLMAAVVLSIVAGVGYVALPDIAKRNLTMVRAVPMAYLQSKLNKAFPPSKTLAREVPAPAAFATAAASPGAAEGETPPVEEGKATVIGSLRGFFGGVAGEANVLMERITWGPGEMPPAKTDRRQAVTDNNGNFTFGHVPLGEWSVIAWGPGGTGGSSVTILPDTKETNRPIKVYPCGACAGVVLDESGNPLPGAVLYPAGHELAPNDEFDHLSGAAGRAQADDQGRFRFPAMIQGGIKYFVAAPGREPQYSDYVSTSDGGMRVQLRAPGRLRGQIVAEGGVENLEGMTLSVCAGHEGHTNMKNGVPVYVSGGRIEQTVTTDKNGSFAVDTLSEAAYWLKLPEKSAWLLSAPVDVEVKSGKESSVTVRLERGCTLAGQVVDAATGEALGGNISIYVERCNAHAETDTNGFYRLESVPKGAQTLHVSGPSVIGGKDYQMYSDAKSGSSAWPVEIGQGENRMDLGVLRTRIHGLVTNVSGAPISGAEVRRSYGDALATTGPNGRFEVRCVCAPNEPLQLEAEKDGWRALETAALTPGGETEVTLTLAYRGKGELSGVAVLSDGTPATGMSLTSYNIINSESSQNGGERPKSFVTGTTVGANGAFTLTGMVEGTYNLSLYSQAERTSYGATEIVTLRPDEKRANVRLVFAAPESHILAGKVFNEAGQAVPQCVVMFGNQGNATISGSDGKFSLALKTAEQNLSLTLQATGYSPLAATGEIDKTDLVFTLKKMRHLAGRVVNAAGAPVTGCKIVVSPYGANYGALGPNGFSQTVSNPSGAFDFPAAFAPPATITVTAEGYGPCEENIEGEEYEQPTVLVMYPVATIAGVVVDAHDTPMPGYQVECGRETLVTDPAGHFSFEKCGAGKEYTVTVRPPQGGRAEWSDLVTAPANVQSRIGQTGNIALYVKLDGVAVADPVLSQHCSAHASFQAEDGGTASAEFVPRTQFLYGEGLPAGSVRVSVRLDTLEAFGPPTCERLTEALVEPDGQIAVEVNFETPNATPAPPPATDNAPATPGATEE